MGRIKSLFIIFTLAIDTQAPPAHADTTTFAPDCKNYCAFSEFENNCQGIKFKSVGKDGSINHYYTHYSSTLQGCVYNRIPRYHFVSQKSIDEKCTCAQTPTFALPLKNKALSARTAIDLHALREKIKSWAPCAPDPFTLPTPHDDQHPLLPSDIDSCENMQKSGKKGYYVVGGCTEAGNSLCTYFGNTNAAVGPYCFAGNAAENNNRCDDIKSAQDPVTGAWYRNAYQRRFPMSERGQPLFSRDEFIGVMLYLSKTHDKVAAEKWLRFINNNPHKNSSFLGSLIKTINICPLPPAQKPDHISENEWQEMQPDDRCELRSDSYAMMYHTYLAMGFTDRDLRKISPRVYAMMKVSLPFLGITSNISSRSVRAISYEEADQAINLLALRAAGAGDKILLKDAARAIDERTGYESPFYHWLALGGKTSEYGAYLIKKYCSPEKPHYGNLPTGGVSVPSSSFFDYGVHFFGGLEDDYLQNTSVGHDCIGWIDLYLQ